MAGTKVIIAQADYKHLLAAVTLLAGDTDETAETVGYVFSQLEELGIEVEAELEVDPPISTEDITQLLRSVNGPAVWDSKLAYPSSGPSIIIPPKEDEDIDKYRLAFRVSFPDLLSAIKGNQFEPFKCYDLPEMKDKHGTTQLGKEPVDSLSRLLAACPKPMDNGITTTSTRTVNWKEAVFEDPAVDIETVLLVIDTQPNVTRLVFHPETPYRLVNAVKAKTNLECVVNDKIKTTEEGEHASKDDTAMNSLVEYAERLDKLLKSDGYAFNARARVLLIYLSNVEDISLLLTHFRSQLNLCVITEIVSEEDLSSLQFQFAEVKICCLNGI